jgi:hypothetical protein
MAHGRLQWQAAERIELCTGREEMNKAPMTYTMVADRKSDGNLAETANLPHMCLGCSLLLDENERKWVNGY